MQCRVRDEVEVRQQKRREEVKCFRCWGIGHHKWEYPNIEVERQRRKSEQAVYMVGPQEV